MVRSLIYSPYHKLHTHTLFTGPPQNPRLQRYLRELWVYRKPRTQDNSESQVLNPGRPCTSHIPDSPTSENLWSLGFRNLKTCPDCRSGDPPRGKPPHAQATRSPQSAGQPSPTSRIPGPLSPGGAAVFGPPTLPGQDPGPKRIQPARNPRAVGRTAWPFLTRQRRHGSGRGHQGKDHPVAAAQVRARLRFREEVVSASAARRMHRLRRPGRTKPHLAPGPACRRPALKPHPLRFPPGRPAPPPA